MTCDACGHDVPPDARFCPNCGTAVDEQGQDDHRGDDSGAAAEAAETSEASATEPTARRSTVVTVLGNVLAVAAGGTLGAVAGWLIVRAM